MPKEATAVVYRKWKDNGQVIALFPELPSDIQGWYCDSYMHVGQHGAADYYGVVQHTTPATRKESGELARELRRIGYRLKVMRRASHYQHERRRQIARQFSSV